MIDDKTDKLIFKGIRSQKQRLFIELYCNPESESYDNGSQSYLKAYNSKNTNVSAVEAHRLLQSENIQNSMTLYKAYIADQNMFELGWLDNNLRNLYYRVKNDITGDDKTELAILKTIGNRIGAFVDVKQDNVGKTVELSPEQEQNMNRVMQELMDAVKRESAIKPVIQVQVDKETLEN